MQEKARRIQRLRLHSPQGVIPIGVTQFAELVQERYTYIDKSLFVRDVVSAGDKVVLLTRPRRFGKTLNLDMLRSFLEKSENPQEKDLFAGLLIKEEEEFCTKHQGKYPMISVSFKDAKESTWESGYKALREIVQTEVSRHLRVCKEGLNHLEGREQRALQQLAAKDVEPDELKPALKLLSKLLAEHYREKPYVLIDEYDTPLIAAYQHGYYDEMLELKRSMLSQCLKDNAYLGKGVMTGILRVAKEDIFSGLNNLGCYGVMNEEYSEWFGFTPEEVHALLEAKGLLERKEVVQEWYNGYRIGEQTVYNPWSVIRFVGSLRHRAEPYWVNVSDNALVHELLTVASVEVKQGLKELLDKDRRGTSTQRVGEYVPLRALQGDSEHVWSLLLASGYVTCANSAFRQQGTGKEVTLKLPNEEVNCVYIDLVKGWLNQGKGAGRGDTVVDMLVREDLEGFSAGFEKYVREAVSYFDAGGEEPEKFYQAFVLGMMMHLQNSYHVRSERESGWGRYDLAVEPKDTTKPGFVLEFKRSLKPEQLEADAAAAVQQIKHHRYSQELLSRGVTTVYALGLAFCGKLVVINHALLVPEVHITDHPL